MQFLISPVTFRPQLMDLWLFLYVKETEKERGEERREKSKEKECYVQNNFVHNHLSGKQYHHENLNFM